MSEHAEEYIDASLPDDERLENIRALSTGACAALDFFLQRINSYHELLELELEDLPTGAQYLQEACSSLEKAVGSLGAFSSALKTAEISEDKETFDLVLLTKGMCSRLDKILDCQVVLDLDKLEEQEAYVKGRLFLFQEILLQIPHLVDVSTGESTLTISLSTQHFDDAFFRNRKLPLTGGEYYALSVCLDGRDIATDQLIPYNERIVRYAEQELTSEFLLVLGVIRGLGGELFSRRATGPVRNLCLLVPVEISDTGMYTEASVSDEALRGTETILLVDDEAIIWDVVIDMLQGMGYTVILAADGRDCVEIYRDNPNQIDLVLLDMVMPEMNGKEAFFALRDIDPGVKVLLQSGYINEEDAQDVLDAGAKGFLRKPYRMHQLAQRIRRILG